MGGQGVPGPSPSIEIQKKVYFMKKGYIFLGKSGKKVVRLFID